MFRKRKQVLCCTDIHVHVPIICRLFQLKNYHFYNVIDMSMPSLHRVYTDTLIR